jgi:hypothetical protein
MRTRLMLIGFVVLATAATGCHGKRKGPYFAPQPARISAEASPLQASFPYQLNA